MRQEIIFSMKNTYRDDFRVTGYHFGKQGHKAACIGGAMRGNEVQHL